MVFLGLRAFFGLVQFEVYLARKSFSLLYEKVRNYPLNNKVAPSPDTIERISTAVDMACIWYWKEALCLQRSATAACLLKRYGVPAHMVIGAQQMPFKAHAWVEVRGVDVGPPPGRSGHVELARYG